MLAGARQQLITVGIDLPGKPDIALPFGRHQILEQMSAHAEFRTPQVMTIEIEQIEGHEERRA